MSSDATASIVSRAVVVAAAAAAVLLPLRTAEAIPAFARKYQTSCQTCHIAFPKLNPFGEVFRLHGYRIPEETEDMIRERPVQLGGPAFKRVWPDAVWPSDIPGTVRRHVEMEAFVVVLETPYFSVTDPAGAFEITNVPPGKYTLVAWSEALKEATQDVTVNAGKQVMVSLTLTE